MPRRTVAGLPGGNVGQSFFALSPGDTTVHSSHHPKKPHEEKIHQHFGIERKKVSSKTFVSPTMGHSHQQEASPAILTDFHPRFRLMLAFVLRQWVSPKSWPRLPDDFQRQTRSRTTAFSDFGYVRRVSVCFHVDTAAGQDEEKQERKETRKYNG